MYLKYFHDRIYVWSYFLSHILVILFFHVFAFLSDFQLKHVHIFWVAMAAGMVGGGWRSKDDSFPNGHTLSQTVMWWLLGTLFHLPFETLGSNGMKSSAHCLAKTWMAFFVTAGRDKCRYCIFRSVGIRKLVFHARDNFLETMQVLLHAWTTSRYSRVRCFEIRKLQISTY